ncbi:MAG: zinc-dependent peptidase [Ginsengibacter sp.]
MQSTFAVGLFVILIVAFLIYYFKNPKRAIALIPEDLEATLLSHVSFYRNLTGVLKYNFKKKIEDFLRYVSIEGVKIQVTDLDRLLVAASAIIPVFYFDNWKYNNLSTVLLYPHPFNREEFLSEESDKDTSGMVGNGPMQRMMILSLPQLREGFSIHAGQSNVGIHEFVHLIDKEDGDVDGLPEALLDKKNNPEYLKLVEETMNEIANNKSDIDAYALTNRAEFFAVTSSYFLNAPGEFKKSHEALYNLYKKIYRWPA